MTDDASLRDALRAHVADEPPMQLTVQTVLSAGRRSQTRRQAAAVTVGVLTVGAVLATGIGFAGGSAVAPPHEAPGIATSPSDPLDSTPWTTPTPRPSRSDRLDALPDRPPGPDRPRESGYPVV